MILEWSNIVKVLSIGLGIFILTCSAGAEVFLETFDDRDIIKQWQELKILNFGIPGAVHSWKIVGGQLQSKIIGEERMTRLFVIGDEAWQDYDIELDVKPLRKHGPAHIVIASRIHQDKKGQTWGVLSTIGDTPIPEPESLARCFGGRLLVGDIFLRYKTKPYRSLSVKNWSHLKLSVHGKRLTFWINGKQVLGPVILEPKNFGHGVEFPDYAKGKVGFGVSNYSALFDNLRITTGDDIPKSVTPRTKLATTWGNLKQF
ncbi:hypothetical protein C6503_27005 [Candidatus Poribacteria bacterium]|nr:MAG: hypothetical protein C6503_27005 [Candidatus Poribacteria bacterium]